MHLGVRKVRIFVLITKDANFEQDSILFFWVMTSRGLVCRYQHFGGIYCQNLQGRYHGLSNILQS
jgi:hypothetical protein